MIHSEYERVRRHFDLSRNGSLRTLEITAESVVAVDANSLRAMLSTITSPHPLDIVIIYSHSDVRSMAYCNRLEPTGVVDSSTEERGEGVQDHQRRFRLLRGVCTVREFRLVFCANARGYFAEISVHMLERLVKMEKAKGD